MTHREFFDSLRTLGPLRVISQSGPSVFEAICRVEAYGVDGRMLNAITDAYHWHMALDRFRHLTSHDEMHQRSGRRVLYFALREEAGARPFLLIYVHRAKGADFEPEREAAFASVHARLAGGAAVQS
jgi:hypothetical protein